MLFLQKRMCGRFFPIFSYYFNFLKFQKGGLTKTCFFYKKKCLCVFLGNFQLLLQLFKISKMGGWPKNKCFFYKKKSLDIFVNTISTFSTFGKKRASQKKNFFFKKKGFDVFLNNFFNIISSFVNCEKEGWPQTKCFFLQKKGLHVCLDIFLILIKLNLIISNFQHFKKGGSQKTLFYKKKCLDVFRGNVLILFQLF